MSRAALFLLIVGLLQMTGDLFRLPALKAVAAATGASPAPEGLFQRSRARDILVRILP